jgi:hypothetical protein
MAVNRFGVDEKDLVIRPHNVTIPAEKFCKAMRELQRKAQLVNLGVEEFSATDLFTLQMAGIFKNWVTGGGTAVTMPDDIMEIMFPDWKKETT